MSKWIKVEEKKPDTERAVIVKVQHSHRWFVREGYYSPREDEFDVRPPTVRCGFKVVAWIDMPEDED